MELLPDFSVFGWIIVALYGWYVPVLLVLTCPQLQLPQKLRWVPLCLLFSWLGYYLLKFKLKNYPAADIFTNK
jgi:hypothetical protein